MFVCLFTCSCNAYTFQMNICWMLLTLRSFYMRFNFSNKNSYKDLQTVFFRNFFFLSLFYFILCCRVCALFILFVQTVFPYGFLFQLKIAHYSTQTESKLFRETLHWRYILCGFQKLYQLMEKYRVKCVCLIFFVRFFFLLYGNFSKKQKQKTPTDAICSCCSWLFDWIKMEFSVCSAHPLICVCVCVPLNHFAFERNDYNSYHAKNKISVLWLTDL